MTGTVTEDGIDVLADLASGISTEKIEAIAIGSGESSVEQSDSSMESELHREAPESITSVAIGEREYSITITGGSEVPAGSSISEFGLTTSTSSGSGKLVYHEVAEPITVSQGVNQKFIVTFDINIGDINE